MRFLLLLLLTLNFLSAEKLALLIGNSQYIHLDKLSSPSKDIPALAKKLRDMKFKVVELYDLDEKLMKKAIKDFKVRLQRSPNAIALFYYLGHGSQAYGDSYLIPIDGDTRDEADVETDGVEVEWIVKKMANARTKANILFLDACRDVPTGTMGNGTKGLGQVKNRPSGSLILYSTSKNTTAKDNRLFNKVVLEKLATNVPLTTLANDISYSVDQKTDGKQVPEVFAKSLPTLCLTGKCTINEIPPVEPKVDNIDFENFYKHTYINMSLNNKKQEKYLFKGLSDSCSGANDLNKIKKDIKNNNFSLEANNLKKAKDKQECDSLLKEYLWKEIRKNCSSEKVAFIKQAPSYFNFEKVFSTKNRNEKCNSLMINYAYGIGLMGP